MLIFLIFLWSSCTKQKSDDNLGPYKLDRQNELLRQLNAELSQMKSSNDSLYQILYESCDTTDRESLSKLYSAHHFTNELRKVVKKNFNFLIHISGGINELKNVTGTYSKKEIDSLLSNHFFYRNFRLEYNRYVAYINTLDICKFPILPEGRDGDMLYRNYKVFAKSKFDEIYFKDSNIIEALITLKIFELKVLRMENEMYARLAVNRCIKAYK